MRILLVNPPIHDFSARDFWLKPYGLLEVAGRLRGQAEFRLFDYLDRLHPFAAARPECSSDEWGRGTYPAEEIQKPAALSNVGRRFKRYGLPREQFREWLGNEAVFDVVLIQTVMTYWYPGVKEVIEDVRSFSPHARIVLGGVYATVCPDHGASLGADLIIRGTNLRPLWSMIGLEPDVMQAPLWEAYPRLEVGVVRLSDGCPFCCTYCSVPGVYGGFSARPLARCLGEWECLVERGVKNVAFYDDALLYKPEVTLLPFLKAVAGMGGAVNLHTPNAINAAFVTSEVADWMARGGVRTFHLGLESAADDWHARTGNKTCSERFRQAVSILLSAGVERHQMTTYVIVGHPDRAHQWVEETMRFANDLGLRVMLSEFSPVPGTPDGDRALIGLDPGEPLHHNKTAFTIRALGREETERLKTVCRELNRRLSGPAVSLTLQEAGGRSGGSSVRGDDS